MNYGIDLVVRHDGVQRFMVAHIADHQVYRLAGNFRGSVQRCARAVTQIVNGDDFIAGLQQFNTGVRTDIATGTRYQDSFFHSFFRSACPFHGSAHVITSLHFTSPRKITGRSHPDHT